MDDATLVKQIISVCAEHDKGLVLGPFTRVGNLTVKEWVKDGSVMYASDGDELVAIVVVERAKTTRRVKDFSDSERLTIAPGQHVMKKIACRKTNAAGEALRKLLEAVPADTYMEGWIEHPLDRLVAEFRELVPCAVKVRSTSELWGIFGHYSKGHPYANAVDIPTLTRLDVGLFEHAAAVALALQDRPPTFADHYSNYNAKHAWSAVSLRGYGPPDGQNDPLFIAKPIEMTKDWKQENPEKLAWVLSDSPARAQYPEVERLLDEIPGVKHRVRLMNLAPGGGELQRHTDIQDPEAGTQDGQLVRIHVPIVTNPRVVFTMWSLLGDQLTCSMKMGELWYLDTRKPHKAVNGGDDHRVHLVVDVESSKQMREWIVSGEEAEPEMNAAFEAWKP